MDEDIWVSSGEECFDHPGEEPCELPCPECDRVCDPIKRRKITNHRV